MARAAAGKAEGGQAAIKQSSKAVAEHSRSIADSAKELEQSSAQIESSADRTILAAERTYASWVRTGLFSLASGIGAHALLTGVLPKWLVQADASMLVLFSIFCFGAAIWRHLNPGPPPPAPNVRRISGVVLILVNTFLALVSAAALIGIWV